MSRIGNKAQNLAMIIQSALELGKENGFSHVSISALAKKAGISQGTIYIYFKNKEEMLNWLFDEVRKKSEPFLLKDFKDNDSLSNKFQKLVRNIIKFYEENPLEFGFVEQCAVSPLTNNSTSVFSPKVEEVFRMFYLQGVEQKRLYPMDLSVMGSLVHGPILNLMRKVHTGNYKLTRKDTGLLCEALWRAIALPGA